MKDHPLWKIKQVCSHDHLTHWWCICVVSVSRTKEIKNTHTVIANEKEAVYCRMTTFTLQHDNILTLCLWGIWKYCIALAQTIWTVLPPLASSQSDITPMKLKKINEIKLNILQSKWKPSYQIMWYEELSYCPSGTQLQHFSYFLTDTSSLEIQMRN